MYISTLARAIVKFYQDPENVRKFHEWQAEQRAQKAKQDRAKSTEEPIDSAKCVEV